MKSHFGNAGKARKADWRIRGFQMGASGAEDTGAEDTGAEDTGTEDSGCKDS